MKFDKNPCVLPQKKRQAARAVLPVPRHGRKKLPAQAADSAAVGGLGGLDLWWFIGGVDVVVVAAKALSRA
jgi:hypothetical protein